MPGWLCGKPILLPTHGSGDLGRSRPRLGVGGHRATILPTTVRRLTLGQEHHTPKLLIRKKLLAQLRGWQGHLGLGRGRGSWEALSQEHFLFSGAVLVGLDFLYQGSRAAVFPDTHCVPCFLLRASYMEPQPGVVATLPQV